MAKKRKNLTILQINDTHGYLESHPELFHGAGEVPEVRTAGGFAHSDGDPRSLQRQDSSSFKTNFRPTSQT